MYHRLFVKSMSSKVEKLHENFEVYSSAPTLELENEKKNIVSITGKTSTVYEIRN